MSCLDSCSLQICRLRCLPIFINTEQKVLLSVKLNVCFIRIDSGTRPCCLAYLYERECFQLHLNALKLRSDQRTNPDWRSSLYMLIFRYGFEFCTPSVRFKKRFYGVFPPHKLTMKPREKSTMFHTVDWIRITPAGAPQLSCEL